MGEKRNKSRHRAEILAKETRCIYCAQPPATVEHMPPTSMFRDRQRLSGLEFACCAECNNGTRAADAVAAFMSRLHITNDVSHWRVTEGYKLMGAITTLAPAVVREIFGATQERRWIRTTSPLLQQVVKIQADGPVLKALMTVFTAKLGMALFREHCGEPLPLSGGVYTQFYFNAGLSEETAAQIMSIMPVHGQLTQGKRHSTEQFAYRYNTDERTIIGALAGFHSSLHVRMFAVTEPERYTLLQREPNADFVRPGELADRINTALGLD